MLEPNTRVKSKFLTEDGKYILGTIKSSQEESLILARGYFILFDDYDKQSLFINEKALYELYDIIYEPVDESVYKINDNGQISFI